MLLALTGGETVTLIVAVLGFVSTVSATLIARIMEERAADSARKDQSRREIQSRLMDQRYETYSSLIALYRRAIGDEAAKAAARDEYFQAYSRAMLVASASVRAALQQLSEPGDADALIENFAAAAAADLGVPSQILEGGPSSP